LLFPSEDDENEQSSTAASSNQSRNSSNQSTDQSTEEEKEEKIKKAKREKIRKEKLRKTNASVREALEDLMTNDGFMPHFVLRFTDTGAVTPTGDLSLVEQTRRKAMLNLYFKVNVRVNGKVITSSSYRPLSKSLSVDFRKLFDFRIVHQPRDLSLDVYYAIDQGTSSSFFGFRDTYLASIPVPFPGQNSSSSNSYSGATTSGGGGDIAGSGFGSSSHQVGL
jgi:hypothetical protein